MRAQGEEHVQHQIVAVQVGVIEGPGGTIHAEEQILVHGQHREGAGDQDRGGRPQQVARREVIRDDPADRHHPRDHRKQLRDFDLRVP